MIDVLGGLSMKWVYKEQKILTFLVKGTEQYSNINLDMGLYELAKKNLLFKERMFLTYKAVNMCVSVAYIYLRTYILISILYRVYGNIVCVNVHNRRYLYPRCTTLLLKCEAYKRCDNQSQIFYTDSPATYLVY